jgi:hypothetical protein
MQSGRGRAPQYIDAHALLCPLDRERCRHMFNGCTKHLSATRRRARARETRDAPAFEALYGVCGCGASARQTHLPAAKAPPYLRNIDDLRGLRKARTRGQARRAAQTCAVARTLELIEPTSVIAPPPLGIMWRAASRAVKNAPWTLMSYRRLMRSNG